MSLLQPSKSLTFMGEQEESYNDDGLELLWEYKIPKTVVKVMGLASDKLIATDESISVMRRDGSLYFRIGIEDEPNAYDPKTGLHILPTAAPPAPSAPQIALYEGMSFLIGMMKGDLVIAAEIAEQSEVPTEVYITTPKVYLKALQKLKGMGYHTDNTETLQLYVERVKQRTTNLDIKEMVVESEVDLC